MVGATDMVARDATPPCPQPLANLANLRYLPAP